MKIKTSLLHPTLSIAEGDNCKRKAVNECIHISATELRTQVQVLLLNVYLVRNLTASSEDHRFKNEGHLVMRELKLGERWWDSLRVTQLPSEAESEL